MKKYIIFGLVITLIIGVGVTIFLVNNNKSKKILNQETPVAQIVVDENIEDVKEANVVEDVVEEKQENNKNTPINTEQTTATKTEEKATVKEPVVETPKQEPTPVVETPKEVGEKYIANNSMAQKIVSIIKNNPGEYMIKNGFDVVIDSTITTKTNYFTFTEDRVKQKIINKFGTIKVYVQDYYNNGVYITTECFII